MTIIILTVLFILVIGSTKKTITYEEAVSPFYGLAYHNMCTLTGTCYPIPINILMGLLYKLWLKCFRFGVNIHAPIKPKT